MLLELERIVSRRTLASAQTCDVVTIGSIAWNLISKPIIKGQLVLFAPRGVTLIFSYIRRLDPFFGGQIFEFQYFLGFSEK